MLKNPAEKTFWRKKRGESFQKRCHLNTGKNIKKIIVITNDVPRGMWTVLERKRTCLYNKKHRFLEADKIWVFRMQNRVNPKPGFRKTDPNRTPKISNALLISILELSETFVATFYDIGLKSKQAMQLLARRSPRKIAINRQSLNIFSHYFGSCGNVVADILYHYQISKHKWAKRNFRNLRNCASCVAF